jgi:long-chain acyl-CoA synthetase
LAGLAARRKVLDAHPAEPAYQELLARGRAQPIPSIVPNDQECAMFIYTSGTTGNPKGVKLSHYNLASNVCGVLDVAPLKVDETSLAFLPWAHVFGGHVELNTVIFVGASAAICDDTTKIVDYLGEVQPTVLFAVPRIWNRIYDVAHKTISEKPAFIQSIFRRAMSAARSLNTGEVRPVTEISDSSPI